MTEFLYPSDLVSTCKDSWEQAQKRRRQPAKRSSKESPPAEAAPNCPPFPSDEQLLELLQTVYHLSLLAEESRRVAVRLIYVPPQTFEQSSSLNLNQKPARLQRPVPLTIGELLKLAPAVQATESAIKVAPAKSLDSGSEDRLMIWGVLHLGTEWWKLLTGAESAAVCPPDCLTISSFAPGALTISTLGSALVRLRNGQLIGTPLPELDEGPIGKFLDAAARELYRDTTKALGRKRYDPKADSDQHPMQLYYRTVARLLHLVREQRHGGTLIVLPDELGPEDGRLADRISIKYRLEMPPLWDTLVDEGVARSHHYRLLFPKPLKFLTHDKRARPSKLKELIHWKVVLKVFRSESVNSVVLSQLFPL
jgi:hypothetical protein